MAPSKVSSLTACAIAAARSTEAVRMWIEQLEYSDFAHALRKLRAMGEHHAADILADQRKVVRSNGSVD